MADKIINSNKSLMFEIISTELEIKESLKTIYIKTTSSNPYYINSSIFPMFELRSYHEETVKFRNLLDFVEITGGKF